MSQHHEVLSLILEDEGGLNENEPVHVGGVSYAGITQQTYDGWCAPNNPVKSVKDLANHPDLVHEFYEDYFTKYHVWELPECLQYIFADFVVNAGSAAVKIIQRFAGVDDDGIWGSGTSEAVLQWKLGVDKEIASDPNADNELITAFHEQKIQHYTFLATENPQKYGQYLSGWKQRANKVLSRLSKYFESEAPAPKAFADDDPMQVEQSPTVPDIKIDLSKVSDAELIAELSRRLGVSYNGQT